MFDAIVKKSRLCAPLLAVVPIAILLLGRFWWPGETSAWAGSIRIALGFFLIFFLLSGRLPGLFKLSELSILILLLFSWVAVSVLALDGESEALRRGLVILVFLYAVAVLVKEREDLFVRVLKLSALLGATVALVTLMLKLRDVGLGFEYRAFRLHSSGIPGFAQFNNPIISGMHIGLSGMIAFWCMLNASGRKQALFWLVCLAVLALYIFLTFSRSAWLAMLLGGLAMLVRYASLRQWLALSGVAATILCFVWWRFPSIFAIEGARGVTHRDVIWEGVLGQMPGYWWQGHGADAALQKIQIPGQIVSNTHSLYLEILYQYGLIGLFLFALILLASLRRLWVSKTKTAGFGFGIILASAGVMFFELNSFVHSPNLIWLWVWMPIAIALVFEPKGRTKVV